MRVPSEEVTPCTGTLWKPTLFSEFDLFFPPLVGTASPFFKKADPTWGSLPPPRRSLSFLLHPSSFLWLLATVASLLASFLFCLLACFVRCRLFFKLYRKTTRWTEHTQIGVGNEPKAAAFGYFLGDPVG
ncbi:unnamed protein product [Polarella glacialis]|uniref:Uncharacterized protein n=1 Tax=Polarella glacialis TaxID=89957 RepID=A0A813IX65_POLGL|nr:unnamed protein product [Polarella glacialis]